MQTPDTPIPASGLLRLTAAAQIVGLTPEGMRAALKRQQIPICTLLIGKRQFIRAIELQTWLSSTSAPSPACTDLFN